MKFLKLFFSIVGLSFLASCGSSFMGGAGVSTGSSKATGWKYNDPNNGGFEVRIQNDLPTAPGLIFVPGGTFTMGRVAEDLLYDWNNAPRRVTVDSYYLDATEVRNVDYREYVHWLQLVYVSYPEVYFNALPDTLAWRSPLSYNEPLVQHYFRLTSFNEYPVVAVSWLQASEYCNWRTDRVNELSLIRSGILDFNVLDQKDDDSFSTDAYLAGLYTGKVKRNLPDLTGRNPEGRRASYEDGILFPKYRLPTEAEWEYGAVAQVSSPVSGLLTDRGLYPWKGNRVRQSSGDDKGRLMANFQKGRGDLMGLADGNDGVAPTPMPVNSFMPNDYGLYCMAGNVSEWVLDIYRALSFEEVDEFRPFRGNVYTEIAKDEEGNAMKDSLGHLVRNVVGEVKGRNNYTKGDNRNYRDGDMLSAVTSELDMSNKEVVANSEKMYYQGSGPNKQGMSTFVNESSRVFKGGSFKDRAYWLSPGTRRFLDEKLAKEDVGFRCAMDRLGGSNFSVSRKK